MPYQRNLRKGVQAIPSAPIFRPAGPFRTEQDGNHSNLIFDANGVSILRVRSGADSRRIAEWTVKVMNAAHYVVLQSERTKAIFEKSYEQLEGKKK